jgi:hypothetical protein
MLQFHVFVGGSTVVFMSWLRDSLTDITTLSAEWVDIPVKLWTPIRKTLGSCFAHDIGHRDGDFHGISQPSPPQLSEYYI